MNKKEQIERSKRTENLIKAIGELPRPLSEMIEEFEGNHGKLPEYYKKALLKREKSIDNKRR